MEILKALLDMLLEGKSGGVFSLLNALSDNSFDLGKTLSNFNFENAMPVIRDFLSSFSGENPAPAEKIDAFSPIKKVASDEIVATLNGYFESTGAV